MGGIVGWACVAAGPVAAATCTFGSANGLSIPPSTATSTLAALGVSGTVTDVRVRLLGLQELSFGLFEVDVLVVGPLGDQALLMSFACNNFGPISPLFSKDATTTLPSSDVFDPACGSSTYLPADYHADANPPKYVLDSPPAPKPTVGSNYATDLAVWAGKNPNGIWSLYAASDSLDDNASLTGWQLLVTAETCALFADGFESGDLCVWSDSFGGPSCS